MFHYIFYEILFVNITTNLIRKVFKYWEMIAWAVVNIGVFWILSLATNIPVVFLDMTGSSCLFWENVCQVSSLNSRSLSVFSSKNGVHEKNSQFSSQYKLSHTCVPQSHRCPSLFSGNASCLLPISSYRILRCILWLKCDEIIFTASSRTFLHETDICFLLPACGS